MSMYIFNAHELEGVNTDAMGSLIWNLDCYYLSPSLRIPDHLVAIDHESTKPAYGVQGRACLPSP
jgi:hypothetical protein